MQVDGGKNSRLESVHLKQFPISAAQFTPYNGAQSVLMVSSATRSLAEYDMQQGSAAAAAVAAAAAAVAAVAVVAAAVGCGGGCW